MQIPDSPSSYFNFKQFKQLQSFQWPMCNKQIFIVTKINFILNITDGYLTMHCNTCLEVKELSLMKTIFPGHFMFSLTYKI